MPENTEIPEYALDFLNSIAKKEGFEKFTISSAAGSNHGDGFQGVMLRITIEGERKQSNNILKPDRLSLICKMPPHEKARRQMFNSAVTFTREIHSYEYLMPQLVKFQREKDISQADGFYAFPKYYGTFANVETGDYVLAMEDLKSSGYEMWNKFETLDFQHASQVMKELGRFHALSFAIRDQQPEVFEEFKKIKSDVLLKMMSNEMARQYWPQNYLTAATTLNTDETYLIERLENLSKSYLDDTIECLNASLTEPFAVINHGDYWNNNLMYRYLNGSREPSGVCIVDWQIAQYCTPAADVSYFLFTSTEKCLRDQHYDDLIRIYYDSLAELINRCGSDASKLFTFDNLQEQLKRFGKYGIVMAPMLMQVITVQPNDIPDLDEMARNAGNETSEQLENVDGWVNQSNPVYHKRMSEVIRDYYSKNYDL